MTEEGRLLKELTDSPCDIDVLDFTLNFVSAPHEEQKLFSLDEFSKAVQEFKNKKVTEAKAEQAKVDVGAFQIIKVEIIQEARKELLDEIHSAVVGDDDYMLTYDSYAKIRAKTLGKKN